MSIEKHDLKIEFPELADIFHDLKMTDRHFSHELDKYNELDDQIRKIEEGIESTTDEHLEELKLKRLHLKDELYKIMKEKEAAL